MIAEELQNLIQQGENLTTEFKEKITSPNSLAAEIIALTNSKGGYILIGVNDQGNIIGLDVSQKQIEEEIMNICQNNCEPPIIPEFDYIKIGDKIIAILKIYQGLEPHHLKTTGQYYIRVGSTKRISAGSNLKRMFQTRGGLSTDETPITRAQIKDISKEKFQKYVETAFDEQYNLEDEKIYKNLLIKTKTLMKDDSGLWHPNLGGLLMFGKDPQEFLPFTKIQAIKYRGQNKDSNERVTGYEYQGDLIKIINQGIEFVENLMLVPSKISGVKREEFPEYPIGAAREAIINAVAHRDYTITGSHIQILMFSDRLEIISPGSLPNSQTIDELGLRPPYARNQLIVGFLHKMRVVEQAGEGILKIRRLLSQNQNPAPVFQEKGESLEVVFYARQELKNI